MQPTAVKGFNLSIQQAHLWDVQGESQVYRTLCTLKIAGELDLEIFQQAFKQQVSQHTILHTQFRCMPGMEVPLQVISAQAMPTCSLVSLDGMELLEQEKQLAVYIAMAQETPFDLEHGPLLRCALYRFSAVKHVLLINLSAFCGDAITVKHLITELTQRYIAYLGGMVSLEEEPLQYVDVSAWQNELLAEDDAQEHYHFWQRADLSLLNSLLLPFERGSRRKAAQELPGLFAPSMVELSGEEMLSPQLENLLRRTSTSLEAFVLSCWMAVIWRLTGQTPVLLGVECHGRTHEELVTALGPYTQAVPVSISFNESLPFERALILVHAFLEEAKKRQLYFRWQSPTTGTESRHDQNFFPISFAYEEWPTSIHAGNLTFSLEKNTSNTEPFALKLQTLRAGRQLRHQLYFDPRYLSVAAIQRLAQCLDTFWQAAMLQPEALVGMLPLLSSQEQHRLLSDYSTPAAPLPFQTLSQAFEAQVDCYAEQTAIICGSEQLTYRQLNEKANQLAHLLLKKGVGPDVLVGLYTQRSLASLVGMLAVLKAGGAYVPLDPEQPPARLAYQLRDLQTPLLLTQRHLRQRLSIWDGQVVCLDEQNAWESQEAKHNPGQRSGSENLAYVMYTSGSTGTPKGVMIRQRGVMNYTAALCKVIASQPGLHFATVSTLAADLGNTVIFCALASGGCLHILDYATVTSGEAFADYVAQHPIDVLKIVPSHLAALLASCGGCPILPRKHLVSGGEALSYSLLRRLEEQQATCCVVNHYGPTETTIGALINVLGTATEALASYAENESRAASVPIGRPIAGMEAYILDQFQQVVPVGVTGELHLGGQGLAAGYLGLSEQTQARFVKHPWSDSSQTLLYRTGDLARYGDDGNIEFVGRTDSQVKLRGYRIELGEIEVVLGQHPGVRENVVVLREDTPDDKRLVAYVVRQQPPPDEEALRLFIQERLPAYMVPSAFVFLRALSLNANGKVDFQQLPPPDVNAQTQSHGKPYTAIEEILAGIWQAVLRIEQVGVHDNFFQLGGHSLLATQVISRVRAALQVDLPITSLFETPTIAGMAARLIQELRRVGEQQWREVPPIVPVARDQQLPLSFAQQRLWFLHQLDPFGITYNVSVAVRLRGQLDGAILRRALAGVIQRHESLRTTFPECEGQPVQQIAAEPTTELVILDLNQLAQEQREASALQLARQEAELPFDLTRGPLLRCQLLLLAEQDQILLLSMHHIISDGWSMSILVQELTGLYSSLAQGKAIALPPLSVQYADYAVWQRNWLQGEVLQQQLDYWKQHLADVADLELPSDYPRSAVQPFPGTTHFFSLPPSLLGQLKTVGQQEGVTLFMILLAALNVLLHYCTGQDDIAVGTDIANRNRAETERVIGFFVNQLVLRTNLGGDPSFRAILQRVRKVALGAYVHQDFPFDRLLMELNPERDLSRTPLCQVKLVLQNTPPQEAILPDLKVEQIEFERNIAKFDLLFNMLERDDGLFGWLQYRTDLFSTKTIKRFLRLFELVLEQAATLSDVRLSEIGRLLKEVDVQEQEQYEKELKQKNMQKIGQARRKQSNQ